MNPDEFISNLNEQIKAVTGNTIDPDFNVLHDFNPDTHLNVDWHPLDQQVVITITKKV